MKEYLSETIENLFIEFDEMSFYPATLHPHPDEYIKEWRSAVLSVFDRMMEELEMQETLLKNAFLLYEKVEREKAKLQKEFDDLKLAYKELIANCRECTVVKDTAKEVLEAFICKLPRHYPNGRCVCGAKRRLGAFRRRRNE